MRFLIDEMFAADVAERLRDVGHDAVHVGEVGLTGGSDADLLTSAAADDRVVVTENAADFVPLLDASVAGGIPVPPVMIALKRRLPAGSGAMTRALVVKLDGWAQDHPDPYRHVHWLP